MTTEKKDDGGPAFPHAVFLEHENGVKEVKTSFGMSLWDYFAANALSQGSDIRPEDQAAWASNVADAMLEERKKRFG